MIWPWSKKQPTPVQVNPQQQLQQVVTEETQKLHDATSAMQHAEGLAREAHREINIIQDDINVLASRIAKSPAGSLDKANLETKLKSKQSLLAEKQEQLKDIDAQLHKSQDVVTNYDKAIGDINRQADTLGVTLDVANANKACAALKSGLKTGNSTAAEATAALEQQIRNANASATVSESLAADPDEEAKKLYLNQ